MPQQALQILENNFRNGLITEATGLTFPQNAVTDTYNCEFDFDGSVYRRRGFDIEQNHDTKIINREDKAITSYLWNNVAGNGDVSVVVIQVGNTLHFYETTDSGTISIGEQATTVTLTAVSGAPIVDTVECQYSDGNGFLFVTHPYIEPLRISYDVSAHTASTLSIGIQIRDFEGDTADPNATTTRPTATLGTLNVSHHYNLLNQGWDVTTLTAWDTAFTTMPSNADVPWRFKDSTDTIAFTAAVVNSTVMGNSPAPKGHFISLLADQDRDLVSGLSGTTDSGTNFQRPSTCAFFAGRMFYSGINTVPYNSNIYFTKIIEKDSEYGACYQVNDPTAEDLFDILPSDGGVIIIPEAGTIYKLMTVPGGMCVFAANGIWFVTGSTGLGFTAVDYTVQKIANYNTLTASSFVSVGGFPCWWNQEGIYIITLQQGNGTMPTVQNITNDKIKAFFDAIPITSKRFAKGFYHVTDNHIRWLYRSTSTTNINEIYEYDRVLNFNVQTGAFYPWTISTGLAKVHAVVPTALVTRPVSVDDVVDSIGDFVIDSLGNQVITFSETGSDSIQFDKYLISYVDGSDTHFTFAERNNENYVDWEEIDDVGENYTSHFISGYKLSGAGIRNFNNSYIKVFSRTDEAVSYKFQGIWDYATTGSGTGEWSSSQLLTQDVSHHNTDYSVGMKRLKVRGRGTTLQFKVASVNGEPFDIIGWAGVQLVNQGP
jgi:hypothetical protein